MDGPCGDGAGVPRIQEGGRSAEAAPQQDERPLRELFSEVCGTVKGIVKASYSDCMKLVGMENELTLVYECLSGDVDCTLRAFEDLIPEQMEKRDAMWDDSAKDSAEQLEKLQRELQASDRRIDLLREVQRTLTSHVIARDDSIRVMRTTLWKHVCMLKTQLGNAYAHNPAAYDKVTVLAETGPASASLMAGLLSEHDEKCHALLESLEAGMDRLLNETSRANKTALNKKQLAEKIRDFEARHNKQYEELKRRFAEQEAVLSKSSCDNKAYHRQLFGQDRDFAFLLGLARVEAEEEAGRCAEARVEEAFAESLALQRAASLEALEASRALLAEKAVSESYLTQLNDSELRQFASLKKAFHISDPDGEPRSASLQVHLRRHRADGAITEHGDLPPQNPLLQVGGDDDLHLVLEVGLYSGEHRVSSVSALEAEGDLTLPGCVDVSRLAHAAQVLCNLPPPPDSHPRRRRRRRRGQQSRSSSSSSSSTRCDVYTAPGLGGGLRPGLHVRMGIHERSVAYGGGMESGEEAVSPLRRHSYDTADVVVRRGEEGGVGVGSPADGRAAVLQGLDARRAKSLGNAEADPWGGIPPRLAQGGGGGGGDGGGSASSRSGRDNSSGSGSEGGIVGIGSEADAGRVLVPHRRKDYTERFGADYSQDEFGAKGGRGGGGGGGAGGSPQQQQQHRPLGLAQRKPPRRGGGGGAVPPAASGSGGRGDSGAKTGGGRGSSGKSPQPQDNATPRPAGGGAPAAAGVQAAGAPPQPHDKRRGKGRGGGQQQQQQGKSPRAHPPPPPHHRHQQDGDACLGVGDPAADAGGFHRALTMPQLRSGGGGGGGTSEATPRGGRGGGDRLHRGVRRAVAVSTAVEQQQQRGQRGAAKCPTSESFLEFQQHTPLMTHPEAKEAPQEASAQAYSCEGDAAKAVGIPLCVGMFVSKLRRALRRRRQAVAVEQSSSPRSSRSGRSPWRAAPGVSCEGLSPRGSPYSTPCTSPLHRGRSARQRALRSATDGNVGLPQMSFSLSGPEDSSASFVEQITHQQPPPQEEARHVVSTDRATSADPPQAVGLLGSSARVGSAMSRQESQGGGGPRWSIFSADFAELSREEQIARAATELKVLVSGGVKGLHGAVVVLSRLLLGQGSDYLEMMAEDDEAAGRQRHTVALRPPDLRFDDTSSIPNVLAKTSLAKKWDATCSQIAAVRESIFDRPCSGLHTPDVPRQAGAADPPGRARQIKRAMLGTTLAVCAEACPSEGGAVAAAPPQDSRTSPCVPGAILSLLPDSVPRDGVSRKPAPPGGGVKGGHPARVRCPASVPVFRTAPSMPSQTGRPVSANKWRVLTDSASAMIL